MPHFDMPLDELKNYVPERNEPSDFDSFWDMTLEDARSYPINARFEPIEYYFDSIDTFDVTFNGFAGQDIKGWLLLPKHRDTSLPCIVEYIGYGGGRGFPHDWLKWSALGYAHLVMDTRGQGSRSLNGDTPDNADTGQTPQYPGFMTRGILSAESYYYRRLITDAVRAVEAAQSHPDIDSDKIIITGASQGGGLTLAVAGLVPNLLATMPDVPFMSHFQRAIRLIETDPYNEIAHYLKVHRQNIDTVMHTLSYFDGMNFSARATAPTLFSVGLMDNICPPSTVFASYNHYQGEKQIAIYEFNNHEGGQTFHTLEKVKFLNAILIKDTSA
ncbi:MAG: acetylxylan esterase [Phototrophicaceae bacterium]